MGILRNFVINIKNKVLSLPVISNKKDSRKFSETTDIDDSIGVDVFLSSEKNEISKEEMSSLTFEHVCKQMSFFNLKVDINPNEWDAFFGVIYDHLASKKLEKWTGRLVLTVFSDLLMNRYALVNRIANNTITFETIFNWLDNALYVLMQSNNFYKLTVNDCYKIKNRIRMYAENSGKSNRSQMFCEQLDSPTGCLMYSFEEYCKRK